MRGLEIAITPSMPAPASANVIWTPPTEISTLAPMNDAANASDVSAFWSAIDTAVQRVRHRGAEQQPVVHEREPVAEAAEDEHRQQQPQVGHERAQQQVAGHAAEPGDVRAAPLPRAA